jgi:hypothetical protein
MKRVKNYTEFINESIFKRDEYLRDELRKLSHSDENMLRIQELVISLKELNKLKVVQKLTNFGYSEYLINNKKFWREFDEFQKGGKPDELIKFINEDEIQTQVVLSKQGKLHEYMMEHGEEFTFGILRAIFKDAKDAKMKTDFKKGFLQAIPRGLPVLLAPFFPVVAIVGLILGTSRTFNKLIKPLFNNLDSDSKYVDFLKTMVFYYMKFPEGEVNLKDRFSRAFVVTDRLIDAIKQETIDAFTKNLVEKMDAEPDDKPVPDHYIENELKKYLNDNYDVDPKIPLKED